MTIGRGPDCDVFIDDVKASRRHTLVHVADTCSIEDTGSTNGTCIGDRSLLPNERVPLVVGEPVTIGTTVLVVREVAEGAPPRRLFSRAAFAGAVDDERLKASASRGSFGLLRVQGTGLADLKMSKTTSIRPPVRRERLGGRAARGRPRTGTLADGRRGLH